MVYALVKSYVCDDFLPNEELSTIIRKRNFRNSKSYKPGIAFCTGLKKPVLPTSLRAAIVFPNIIIKNRYFVLNSSDRPNTTVLLC